MSTTPVKFAIVGAGVIGRWHGLVMSEIDGAALVAVIDTVPERASALAKERGGSAFTSLAEALEHVEFDAVAVCVPSGIHAEIAIEALNAGKHVVVEKPVDIDLAKVDQLADAHRRAGTVLTVISQHRFDPSTEVVFKAIADGRLGRLTSGIASCAWWRSQDYYDSGDWRGTWELDGGGALMNQSVHTIDLLLAAMGRPVEVFAYGDTLAHSGIEVEDTAVAVVKFESGALGVIHGTTAAYPGLSARLQVHGDKGSAVIDDDQLVYIHAHDGRSLSDLGGDAGTNQLEEFQHAAPRRGAGVTGSRDPGALSDAHHYQYANFLAAVAGIEKVRVGLAESRAALAVILAIYESKRTGQPVSLHS